MPDKPEPKGDPEMAARLRAAFAYRGLKKPERAAAIGCSMRQVTRYESAEYAVPADRWQAVAEATAVPLWFFEAGFAAQPQPEEPTLAERVEALANRAADRGQVAQLERGLTELRGAVALLAAGDLRRAQALLTPDETGHPDGREEDPRR
jgi:hypothetical protein